MLSKSCQENNLLRIKKVGIELAKQVEGNRKKIAEISEITGISKVYLYQIRDFKKKNLSETYLKVLEDFLGIPMKTLQGKAAEEDKNLDLPSDFQEIILEMKTNEQFRKMVIRIYMIFKSAEAGCEEIKSVITGKIQSLITSSSDNEREKTKGG